MQSSLIQKWPLNYLKRELLKYLSVFCAVIRNRKDLLAQQFYLIDYRSNLMRKIYEMNRSLSICVT